MSIGGPSSYPCGTLHVMFLGLDVDQSTQIHCALGDIIALQPLQVVPEWLTVLHHGRMCQTWTTDLEEQASPPAVAKGTQDAILHQFECGLSALTTFLQTAEDSVDGVGPDISFLSCSWTTFSSSLDMNAIHVSGSR